VLGLGEDSEMIEILFHAKAVLLPEIASREDISQ
jgi:hypothetical protein